jgi:uncharacterized protein YjiS (DUF1127 family)
MPAAASTGARIAGSESSLRIATARIGAGARRLLATAVERWIARRDERILLQKSEQELKDIGLGRADVRRAVRGELRRAR